MKLAKNTTPKNKNFVYKIYAVYLAVLSPLPIFLLALLLKTAITDAATIGFRPGMIFFTGALLIFTSGSVIYLVRSLWKRGSETPSSGSAAAPVTDSSEQV
jgi:hypothetical protein